MSPRTKEQLKALKSEKRSLIISAGLKSFSAHGYQSSSIASIAKEAGISKGLIYTYFDSKEDLLRSVLFETIEQMFKISLDALGNQPRDKEFEEMIKANFKWFRDHVEFSKIYFGLLLQSNILNMFKDELMILAQPVYVGIARYFELKGYDNPMLEARFFGTMLDGVGMNYIMDANTYPLNEVEQKIISKYIT